MAKKILSEYDKRNMEKVKDAKTAELLMEMVNRMDAELGQEILSQLRTSPVSDIAALKARYEAVGEVIRWLQTCVGDGKLAEHVLNKE